MFRDFFCTITLPEIESLVNAKNIKTFKYEEYQYDNYVSGMLLPLKKTACHCSLEKRYSNDNNIYFFGSDNGTECGRLKKIYDKYRTE